MSATSRRNKKTGRKTTAKVKRQDVANCPKCGGNNTGRFTDTNLHTCLDCKMLFDADPDEGGDYSESRPDARLIREETQAERERQRRRARHPANMQPRTQ